MAATSYVCRRRRCDTEPSLIHSFLLQLGQQSRQVSSQPTGLRVADIAARLVTLFKDHQFRALVKLMMNDFEQGKHPARGGLFSYTDDDLSKCARCPVRA